MIEHLKLFHPKYLPTAEAQAMWWGIVYATALWGAVIMWTAFTTMKT